VPIAGSSSVLVLSDLLCRPLEHSCCCITGKDGKAHHCRCWRCWLDTDPAEREEVAQPSPIPQLNDNCPDDDDAPPALWAMPNGVLPPAPPLLRVLELPSPASPDPPAWEPQFEPAPTHPPPLPV